MAKSSLNVQDRIKQKKERIKLSHMTTLKSTFRRKSALVKALQKIDNGRWATCVEVHEEKQKLHGYDEAGANASQSEVIIRRKNIPNAYNDMGFALEADGTYSVKGSDFSTDRHYNQKWLDKLLQTYSAAVCEEVAAEQGFSFEEREENGEIYIECTRSY